MSANNVACPRRLLAARVLSWAAAAMWIATLFAPTPVGSTNGLLLVFYTIVFGWALLPDGPWAVLANFTALWAFAQIRWGRPPRWSIALCIALPATSPTFWEFLGDATRPTWGVHLWTAAILAIVAAGLAMPRPAR